MPTLDETFAELRARLAARERLADRTADPIYYFIFPPAQMIRVKERLPIWKVQLETKDGWNIRTFSLAERIQSFLATHRRRQVWLDYEKTHPFEFATFKRSLTAALTGQEQVTGWVQAELAQAAKAPNGLLVVTDLEAIHPFLRFGAVEQSLQGRCPVPLVILYPGTRTGRTALKFLGVYPEDGNYRSIHVGG